MLSFLGALENSRTHAAGGARIGKKASRSDFINQPIINQSTNPQSTSKFHVPRPSRSSL